MIYFKDCCGRTRIAMNFAVQLSAGADFDLYLKAVEN